MKAYRKSKQRRLSELSKPSRRSMAVFVAVIAFAVVVIVFSLFNTITMQNVSRESAREYVSELTVQISNTVGTDVADKKSSLAGMGDAIALLLNDNLEQTSSDEYLSSYLASAGKSSQFNGLMLFRYNANRVQAGTIDEALINSLTIDHPVVKEAAEVGGCVAYVQNGTILYATPIQQAGQVIGILVGSSSAAKIQDLIDVQIYRDRDNFCIVNNEGAVLIESGDARFVQLRELMNSGSASMVELSQKMKDDLASRNTDVFEVNFTDGEAYFLAYAPVDGEDWSIITLLPVDLFSEIYKQYMTRALIYTIGAAVVFVVLIVLLRSIYRNTRKGLERLAFTDDITSGINNAEFRLRYNQLARTEDPREYSIVMLDIRDFKLINEAVGFKTGDAILNQVYKSIESQLSEAESEFVARAEMDHYFLCLHENTPEGIQARIDAMTKQVNDDCESLGQEINIEFGQGACIVIDPDESISTLRERARLAKNSNKRQAGTGALNHCTFFAEEMQDAIVRNRQLDRMAEQSITHHDFVAYYQPKVSMSTGKVCGAEALVRWKHPEQGLISPGEFVPVLEQSGRIQALDRYVFEEVCRWMKGREDAGASVVPVSINLSRAHFWNDDFLDEYFAIADKYGVDPANIEFEITETMLMEESRHDKVRQSITAMHEHGYRCAVDDFGSGYSSLSLIHELDADVLKFDRSFFLDLTAEKSQIIASSLMNMADELHMGVVIEGIETQEQIDFLKDEKCDVIQGYYYSRPLPEADFNAFLDAR